MPEEAAALRQVGQLDAPEPAAVDAGDAVVPGEPLVDEGVVGVEEVEHAAVVAQGAGEKQGRLVPECLDEVVVEVGIRHRVALDVLEVAQVQPLHGEVVDERPGPQVGEHAPDLLVEDRRIAQPARLRRVEQGVVGDAAPEEKGEPRGDLDVAQPVRRAQGRRRRIALDAEQEVGVDEHPLERELDAGVEAAAALAAAVEEAEEGVEVGRRHRPPIGAPGEPRHDLGRARPLVRRRRRVRPAGEDGAPARGVPGTGRVVGPADADGGDGGVAVIGLVVRQHLARLARQQDALGLPDVADERHPDSARPRLDRHADLEALVRRLQVRLPLRIAPLGDGERDWRGPAAVLAADREALHQLAVDANVEEVLAAQAENVVLPVGPQLDLDQVLAVDREVVGNRHPAPGAEGQVLALAVVLQQQQRHVERLERGRGRRQAHRETADGARRRQVALELRGRDGQHVGVVVEAGVRRLVARQQRRHVEIEGEEIANRVAVLGAVQPVDGARPAGVGIRRRRAVDVGLEPGRHRIVGRDIGPRPARRRHRPGPQLRDHPLPHVGVAARVGSVDGGRVEAEPAGQQPVVVAGDAVAVQHRAGRPGRRLLGRKRRRGREHRHRGQRRNQERSREPHRQIPPVATDQVPQTCDPTPGPDPAQCRRTRVGCTSRMWRCYGPAPRPGRPPPPAAPIPGRARRTG